jgi:nucleoid-associated protein YgaU
MFDPGLDAEQAFDRMPVMNRTRVRRRRTLLAASLAVLAALSAGPLTHASAGSTESPHPARRYVVREGDTIWDIALRFGSGGDPRPLVDAIARANRVDAGALRPGQTLAIPSV